MAFSVESLIWLLVALVVIIIILVVLFKLVDFALFTGYLEVQSAVQPLQFLLSSLHH